MWPTWNTLPAGWTYVMRVALVAVVLFVAAYTGPGHSSSAPSAYSPERAMRGRCSQGTSMAAVECNYQEGKSILARRLTTMLPAMTVAEAIETTHIHRVAGLTGDRTALVTTRPFRAPHHTISDAGLIGGGHVPMPGEVSLAHNGVLFLDELPEFRRHVLEVLRQPLEESLTRI
jgi:Magnesium chelatase, subunit ChlI